MSEVDVERNKRQVVRRRQVLGAATVTAGGLAVLGAAPAVASSLSSSASSVSASSAAIGGAGINPPEDLMREHGVLNRVLLIYKEASRRIDAGEPPPAEAVDAAAWVIRRFVEDYHEALEERYVFPKLADAGRLTSITPVLCLQHWRGRVLTDRIHDIAGRSDVGGDGPRRELVDAMGAFLRMYRPHEAWEDTVVFPALRDVTTPDEFGRLGEIFEERGRQKLGEDGFAKVVAHVADIEKELGIYELSQFTDGGPATDDEIRWIDQVTDRA